jgi:DNA polymerase-3 subunit alpha
VYQEQVMSIAQKVAGYTLAQADLLRRAMGKKKKEILDKEYEPFAAGMRANGFSESAIQTLWEILVPFSDYAFNRAHSAAYGLISYWTAYLKAHYPVEYMAALLSSVDDNPDKKTEYLLECRRMGISVQSPDINVSVANYTPHQGIIRYGLSAIRNVGESAVAEIVAAREERPFSSLLDYGLRAGAQGRNKKTVESLIKAGAFDSFGQPRRALLLTFEAALGAGDGGELAPSEGDEVFSVKASELPRKAVLTFEREMLGLTVSDRPQATLAATAVVLHLAVAQATEERLRAVSAVLAAHPGSTEVRLRLVSPVSETVMRLEATVSVSDQFSAEVARCLAVRVSSAA